MSEVTDAVKSHLISKGYFVYRVEGKAGSGKTMWVRSKFPNRERLTLGGDGTYEEWLISPKDRENL